MKKNILLIVLVSLGFISCSSPSAFNYFKQDELRASATPYTKKGDLISEFETKAILTATYLNSVDGDFDTADTQNFIVGLYITTPNKDKTQRYLENSSYTLTLNDKNATYKQELSEQHKMYGHLPLFNHWAKYYLVKFDTNDSESNLALKLSHISYGEVTLKFEAE